MKVLSLLMLIIASAKADPFTGSCTVNATFGSCSIGNITVSSTVFNPGETASATGNYDGLVLIDAPSETIYGDYSIDGFTYFSVFDIHQWLCPGITIGQGTSVFTLQSTSSFTPSPGQCSTAKSLLGQPIIPSPISLPFTYITGTPVEISASVGAISGPLPLSVGCPRERNCSGLCCRYPGRLH